METNRYALITIISCIILLLSIGNFFRLRYLFPPIADSLPKTINCDGKEIPAQNSGQFKLGSKELNCELKYYSDKQKAEASKGMIYLRVLQLSSLSTLILGVWGLIYKKENRKIALFALILGLGWGLYYEVFLRIFSLPAF